MIATEFLDVLWRDMAILAAVVLPLSLMRIYHTGWLDLYFVHLTVASIVFITMLTRRRLPFNFKGALLVAVLMVLGVGGLYSFGLAANGTFWLICACLITGFLYSARTMYMVSALAVGIFIAISAGYATGLLHAKTDLDLYMESTSSWLNFLITAVMMLVILLRAVKAQQQQLTAVTQHQYRQWLDELPIAIEVVDPDGQAYYHNQAATDLFGLDRPDSRPLQMTAHLHDLNTGSVVPVAKLPAMAAIRGEDSFIDAARLSTPDGDVVVRCWGWPCYQEDGAIGYGISVFDDISQQVMAERHKNEFIANVSHELRTPLTAIRGSIGLMLGGAMGDIPQRAEGMARLCQQNTDRLLFLVNDLLDMQKLSKVSSR